MMAIINTSANNNSSSTKLSSTNNQNSVLIPSSSSSASTTSSMEDENVICPLCMENLDIDDRSFYPCTCGYQICRFCWHRIRSESDDENGLCPACRKQYSENPATFKPLSSEDIQKLKLQKRQKDQQKKQKSESGKRHLADLRVVQKNLVFVVGISPRIADPDVLKKNEFFGKFGKIHKVVVNPCLQGSTASAYITYIRADDALRAIQSVNNIAFDGKTIKVSLGTTKYCSHFMRNQTCPKTECMYLHHYGDPDASFTKEDMQAGKHQDYEKKLLEEFNTHQNNNNNNESNGGGEREQRGGVYNGKDGVKNGKGRVANGSSIQQGVSYSTKLLVNNTPPNQPTDPLPSSSPPTQSESLKPDRTVQHPTQSTTPPCSSSSSSSSSSTSSTDHNVTTATNLLENTILSEEDDEEEEYHEAVCTRTSDQIPHQHQLREEPPVDPFEHEYSNPNTLDLDFDPFHETQKAFEEIINEQVGSSSSGAGESQDSSLLRRFINKDGDGGEQQRGVHSSRDYLLGFQHHQHNNHTTSQHSVSPPHPYHPQTTQSSLLLDFFNNYAYKHVPQSPQTPSSIPPPPGFSQTQQQQSSQNQSSSVLLEKLNRTLLGNSTNSTQNHWGGGDLEERLVNSTAADWMSLDPAIIFSKTSNENQLHGERVEGRGGRFGENSLHGVFGGGSGGGQGLGGMGHHFSERERLFRQEQQQQQSQVVGGFGSGHPLIRPTPTTTTSQNTYTQQQQYQHFNRFYPNLPQQQQQQALPQQQQPRYYNPQSTNHSVVTTPPPPGFAGLHNNIHKPQQQFNNQQVYLQQGMHNGANGSAANGFFPF